MHVVDIVILVGWVAFWAYWLISARGISAGRTRWGRSLGVRAAIVVVVLVVLRTRALGRPHVTSDPWLEVVGLAVFVAGLGTAVWARVTLGQNWGVPMTEKDDPELVTAGPYRWIRHPIYSGIILGAAGTTIAISLYWLLAVVLIGVYFTYSATMEERYLVTRFPEAYPRYQQSTKMLIPFVF